VKLALLLLSVATLCSCQRKEPVAYPELPPAPEVRHAVARPTPTLPPEVIVKVVTEPASLQRDRWDAAKIKPSFQISVDKAVMLYLRTKSRYESVQNMHTDGVPAPVIFCLHYRESSNSFTSHLHEGSSLLHRTRDVPKNRLPPPDDPPYQWEHSANDAIYICDKLQGPWGFISWSLDRIEGYNGLGYRKRAVPSPYLWSGTNVYVSGKFVSDGHYSASAIDQQLGAVAILKRMKERGIAIQFSP
jgi:lysozyme family protein